MVFGKKGDYLDLTALQKRGILKVPEIRKSGVKVGKDGFIEFPGNNAADNNTENNAGSSSSNSPQSGMGFDFLSGLAGANSSNENSSSASSVSDGETPYGGFSENLRVARESKFGEFNEMKNRLETIEFKINDLVEKLLKIETKLDDFKRKVS